MDQIGDRLSASRRGEQLDALAAQPLDVLVVGGGVTGVGVALDAASRGLRVGIVERDDWASGTSSRSSKMIHGGLRYLASGDVGVVRESLRERARLQRNAAHLVQPLPMLLPVYGRGPMPWQRLKLSAGLWAYEVLGHRRAAGSFHQWRSLQQLTRAVPGIAAHAREGGGRLRGAHAYHDGCADDVRLVLAILRRAVSLGAIAVNGSSVRSLLRERDRVVGAVVSSDVRDDVQIEARIVVNATGVWADSACFRADGEMPTFDIAPSKGIHLTVTRARAGIESGIAFFGQTANSNVFIEPWQDDLAFVGTTDTPVPAAQLADPHATEDDISLLLGRVNAFLRHPLQRDDVIASWAGVRPLVTPRRDGERAEDTEDVSRRHLLVDEPGCITITGGKLTAYRAMAQDAVDAAVRQLGRGGACQTRDLALDGCRAEPSYAEVDAVASTLGIDRAAARHLLRRHGSNVPHLVAMVQRDAQLAERLHPERPYLAVEAAWAASHEQARSVDDVLERRTRIGIETRDPLVASDSVRRAMAVGDPTRDGAIAAQR